MLDLGGESQKLLDSLRRRDHRARAIVATPMSVILDDARRLIWKEGGEPERPPMPELGHVEGDIAVGPPLECQYDPRKDGPYEGFEARRAARLALAAEAQAAWEEKARAEAAEWRERVERGGAEGGDA